MDAFRAQHPLVASGDNLTFHHGHSNLGVTTGQPRVYLVFWGSDWGISFHDGKGDLNFNIDPAGAAPVIQELFKGIGLNHEGWSGVMSQYCTTTDGAQFCQPGDPHVGYPFVGAFAGAWYDNRSITNSPDSTLLWQEAVDAAGHFGNITAESNRNAQYILLSPHGAHPDGWNRPGSDFCAWHSSTDFGLVDGSSPYGPIAYTNLPYLMDAGGECGANFVNPGFVGLVDGYTMAAGHEYAETITDPFSEGWLDAEGDENADKCAWIPPGSPGGATNYTLSTGRFAFQTTWSNEDYGCLLLRSLVALANPGPQSVVLGQSLNITLTTIRGTAPFTFFGSVVPPGVSVSSAGVVSGAPTAAGVYTVIALVQDSQGFVDSTSFQVTATQPTVAMPRVLGLTRAQANNAITAAGLNPQIGSEKQCIDPGRVFTQSPDPGALVPLGATVYATVDSGTRQTCIIK